MPLFACLLCLIVSLVILVCIAIGRPSYLTCYSQLPNPDAQHHVKLGRNFWLLGEYSRCDTSPYAPDMLRPPVYPLFAGGVDALFGTWAIFIIQSIVHAISCVLLYTLVFRLFGRVAATVAAVLLATDLMLSVSNFDAMSEPVFLLMLLTAMVLLVPTVLSEINDREVVIRLIVGGLVLGLATLTRPTALYLPLLFGAGLVLRGWTQKHWQSAFRNVALLTISAGLPVGLWIGRNAAVLSLPRLSTVEAANLVYFVGGAGYQQEHNLSLREAHACIAQEYALPSYNVVMNPWLTSDSVAEMDRELRLSAPHVIGKYPLSLGVALAKGVMKASVAHNVDKLAYICGKEWRPPGLASVLRGDLRAFRRLFENEPVLTSALIWETLHVLTAQCLAVLGLMRLCRHRSTWAVGLLVVLILSYFYLTVAMFGLETEARCRAPLLPFWYMLAGVGIAGFNRPTDAIVSVESDS